MRPMRNECSGVGEYMLWRQVGGEGVGGGWVQNLVIEDWYTEGLGGEEGGRVMSWMLLWVAACCCVSLCVAVCCSVLQCVVA